MTQDADLMQRCDRVVRAIDRFEQEREYDAPWPGIGIVGTLLFGILFWTAVVWGWR